MQMRQTFSSTNSRDGLLDLFERRSWYRKHRFLLVAAIGRSSPWGPTDRSGLYSNLPTLILECELLDLYTNKLAKRNSLNSRFPAQGRQRTESNLSRRNREKWSQEPMSTTRTCSTFCEWNRVGSSLRSVKMAQVLLLQLVNIFYSSAFQALRA
jgi:hypothetical protein